MFKNIHNNSLLNKMKKIYNACVKPTNLNYDLKLFILIKIFFFFPKQVRYY